MTLRPAAPSEAAELSALAIRSKAHWGYSRDEMAVFERELTLAPEMLALRAAMVVEEEGAPLGFYTLLAGEGGALEIEHLFVDPAHLRRGVGARLLRHALRRAAERGQREVSVLSDPNATGFYLAHGARVAEEVLSSIPGRTLPRLVLPLPAVDARVRPEAPEDHGAVFGLVESAFGRRAEAELVAALRPLRPSVSLVAEWGGELAGHVFFSPATVRSVDGGEWDGMALAPLAVAPAQQELGIGGRLVHEGIGACRALGATRMFVLGHPGYYPRFGFEPAARYGLRYRSDAFDGSFFVLALAPGALEGVCGRVEYAAPFSAV